MSKLQRWIVGGSLWDIEEHEEGEWVKFSDVDELKAQVPEWVSVESRLPGELEWVVTFGPHTSLTAVKWEAAVSEFYSITHWMPLPKPPTKGKTDD